MPPKQKPSHSSASRRGMSASASSARRLHPGSGHHHHTPAAPKRPPTGAPDHPHYYSAGRTGGGQGSSLRHDSSRARAPDHVLSATHHPGSQALAEHLHQSLRQNRAALEQPSQGEDMHRALFEQSSRPQPERKTAASGMSNLFSVLMMVMMYLVLQMRRKVIITVSVVKSNMITILIHPKWGAQMG